MDLDPKSALSQLVDSLELDDDIKEKLKDGAARHAVTAVSGARKTWDADLTSKGYMTRTEAEVMATEKAEKAADKVQATADRKSRVEDVLRQFGIEKFGSDGKVTKEFVEAGKKLDEAESDYDVELALSTDKGTKGLFLAIGFTQKGSVPTGDGELKPETSDLDNPIRKGMPSERVFLRAARKRWVDQSTIENLKKEDHTLTDSEQADVERVQTMHDAGKLGE